MLLPGSSALRDVLAALNALELRNSEDALRDLVLALRGAGQALRAAPDAMEAAGMAASDLEVRLTCKHVRACLRAGLPERSDPLDLKIVLILQSPGRPRPLIAHLRPAWCSGWPA